MLSVRELGPLSRWLIPPPPTARMDEERRHELERRHERVRARARIDPRFPSHLISNEINDALIIGGGATATGAAG